MTQPNFNIGNNQALPGTEFDNLSPEELRKAINDAYKLKTQGKKGFNPPPPRPVAEKKYVDLTNILGGL